MFEVKGWGESGDPQIGHPGQMMNEVGRQPDFAGNDPDCGGAMKLQPGEPGGHLGRDGRFDLVVDAGVFEIRPLGCGQRADETGPRPGGDPPQNLQRLNSPQLG